MRPVLSLVTLGVADLAVSRAFYAALGWHDSSEIPTIAFLRGAGTHLALWSRAELADDSAVSDDHGGWGGMTLAHNTGSPAEVDAVLEQARSAGGRVLRPGAPTAWGGWSGLFADPDGHRWEVAHNPFWPLAEDGHSVLPG